MWKLSDLGYEMHMTEREQCDRHDQTETAAGHSKHQRGIQRRLRPRSIAMPIVVRHVIDESSPFHGLTREQLHSSEFELIMTVEGIVEATGMTLQARTSFLPDEILWGHRFKPMIVLNEKRCKYEVHYGLFDQTERVPGFESNLAKAEETDEMDPHNASGFL